MRRKSSKRKPAKTPAMIRAETERSRLSIVAGFFVVAVVVLAWGLLSESGTTICLGAMGALASVMRVVGKG